MSGESNGAVPERGNEAKKRFVFFLMAESYPAARMPSVVNCDSNRERE